MKIARMTVAQFVARLVAIDLVLLPPHHERQVRLSEETQRRGRAIVEVRARGDESLPGVVDEADVDAWRQHGEAQFLGARALKGIVEGKRMPENRPRDERTQRRHSCEVLRVELLGERRSLVEATSLRIAGSNADSSSLVTISFFVGPNAGSR